MKLIAETAWHHDGDFSFLKNLVEDILTKTDPDLIKFHITLDYDEYIHTDHPAYSWIKNNVFSENQWEEILESVEENNKDLMLLFNDKKSINFGLKFNPKLIEIHSVCLNDMFLLNHLKDNIPENIPIVLGVGGSDLYEIESAINILENSNIVLMHGFQNYPTSYEDINFSKIKKIMQLYPQYSHGYADHTAWDNENNILITLFGAALGMEYIEKHITNVYGEERVDWQAAINFEMFNDLKTKLNVLSKTFGDGKLELNEGERSYSVFGKNKKAAILTKYVSEKDILSENIFKFKRTGQNTDLSQIDILNSIGKKFKKDLNEGHCLTKEDLE